MTGRILPVNEQLCLLPLPESNENGLMAQAKCTSFVGWQSSQAQEKGRSPRMNCLGNTQQARVIYPAGANARPALGHRTA